MKKFNYFLQFIFVVVLFFIFKLIGYNFSTKLSGYIFLLIGPIFRSNKIILKNLDIAFPKLNSNEKINFKKNVVQLWTNIFRICFYKKF